MNRTRRAESGTKVAKEDAWDQVSALVGRFGQAAEQCAARFDFGISPEVIRARMEPILSDARRIQLAGWGALPSGPALQECFARLRDLAPKTYQKTVARIAGVFVIHSYFRSRMTHEAIRQAISTSSFYELTQDLLDDLLDGGGWMVREAARRYVTASHERSRCPQPGSPSTPDLKPRQCPNVNWSPLPAPAAPVLRPSRFWITTRDPLPTFASQCTTSQASTQSSRRRSLKRS